MSDGYDKLRTRTYTREVIHSAQTRKLCKKWNKYFQHRTRRTMPIRRLPNKFLDLTGALER